MSQTTIADSSAVTHPIHHFEPLSTLNSEFPSAPVTGRPSITNDETKLVLPAGAQVETDSAISPATPTQEEWKAGKQERLIVLCLGIVSLMVALDATIVVPALPNIASAVKANGVQSFWIGTSYLLTYAIVQPLIASLSDIFGRQALLFFAVICFTVGSIVAAVSHDIMQMLIGRVIQGIGGGGIQVLTNVIITDVVPLRQRAAFLAIPQLAWAIGTVIGPLIGGALAHHWRWCYYLNLPFCALGLLMVPLVIRLKHQDRVPFQAGLASIDYIGIILFTGSLTAFLIGLSWGGLNFAWKSYQTLVPLLLGAIVTIASLFWEARIAKTPFIKLYIYDSYSAIAALLAAFLQGYIMYAGLWHWNIYFQGVLGKSAIATGVALLPIMLSTVPSSLITGRLILRGIGARPLVLSGWVIATIGNGLSIIWYIDTPASAWVIIQIVCGLGQGLILIAGVIALQSHVEATHVGSAAGMYSFARALGLAVGVSITGTALQNRLKYWLADANLPVDIAENITEYILTLNSLPSSQQSFQAAVRLAIAKAHRNLSEILVSVTALGLLLMLGLRKGDMDKGLASKQRVEKPSEKAQIDVEMADIRSDSATGRPDSAGEVV